MSVVVLPTLWHRRCCRCYRRRSLLLPSLGGVAAIGSWWCSQGTVRTVVVLPTLWGGASVMLLATTGVATNVGQRCSQGQSPMLLSTCGVATILEGRCCKWLVVLRQRRGRRRLAGGTTSGFRRRRLGRRRLAGAMTSGFLRRRRGRRRLAGATISGVRRRQAVALVMTRTRRQALPHATCCGAPWRKGNISRICRGRHVYRTCGACGPFEKESGTRVKQGRRRILAPHPPEDAQH